ncbi:FAD-dependent oxidoreductase [Lentzea sp. NBRC 105346]|uniref:FAD-dependent monooxygenase n=1 Tax=Lentzea sp. NBRC 105346 TaxID=3032205 RepID=UPI0024A5620C|nr:FAD-dependent monooxygenase [Lentzea sp. NBRC 105346]GLZ35883.1 FAD-dependent oxidoreductase [Lentzea sp. NBRC 105346]
MDYEVVIAGAGPVGLLLACELRLHGVRVVVLERLTAPSNIIKAGAISGRTAASLDRRGLTEEISKVAAAAAGTLHANVKALFSNGKVLGGHFAGIFKLTGMGGPAMMIGQPDLERILAARAAELGVEVRRGHEVTVLEQDDDGVTVDGIRARYLVGCDGGRSSVRKLAGFDFPGTGPTITGHQAMVELADPEKLNLGWHRTPVGMYAFGPTPGRILTVEFDGPPENREVTLEELQASLRHVSGTDVTITKVHTATRWTDNARQVTTYRIGRVLLAGDAAHIHSPFGGQGLNTGLQDAMNLGWKLAAALRGRDDLLDTYTAERHPVGEVVVDNTRAQVALLRPDEQTTALRELFSELLDIPEVNERISAMMQATDIRYDVGCDHPLAGRFVPDLKLGEQRLAELLRDGTPVFLDVTDDEELRKAAGHIRVVTAECPEWTEPVLVRPDGYAAWVGAAAEGLRDSVERWFTPTAAA